MPASNPPWVRFEGVWATPRSVAMLKEARRLYGRGYPRISQGGRNAGAVAASAGTHDIEAFDFATAGMSAANQKRWELCLWKVGFAAWWRPYMFNVWPEHCHAIPKGGWLSRGAAAQERAFRNKRDGLAGNRPYPRIGGYAGRTWEGYRAATLKSATITIGGVRYKDIASVSVHWLAASWKTAKFSRHTWYVQNWLKQLGFYKSALDGIPGPKTRAAYDQFRRSLGLSGSQATGTPGEYSVRQLAARAKTRRKKVRAGK